MSALLPATWEFEEADPDVGFFTSYFTHTCEANLDECQPAETADVSLHNVTRHGREEVAETTTLRCPACGATTAYTDHWPRSFFEEPRP